MNRRQRALVALGLLAASLASTGAVAAAATPTSSTATETRARNLADRFLKLLEAKDLNGLQRFLSPAFQLQRADGTYANKAEYLRKPAIVESHEIDNVRATRVDGIIVTRFDLVVDATIDGKPQSTAPAPRLAIFRKGPDGWQLVAYANFNTPAAEPPQ